MWFQSLKGRMEISVIPGVDEEDVEEFIEFG